MDLPQGVRHVTFDSGTCCIKFGRDLQNSVEVALESCKELPMRERGSGFKILERLTRDIEHDRHLIVFREKSDDFGVGIVARLFVEKL